jgi:hypothetical protein
MKAALELHMYHGRIRCYSTFAPKKSQHTRLLTDLKTSHCHPFHWSAIYHSNIHWASRRVFTHSAIYRQTWNTCNVYLSMMCYGDRRGLSVDYVPSMFVVVAPWEPEISHSSSDWAEHQYINFRCATPWSVHTFRKLPSWPCVSDWF